MENLYTQVYCIDGGATFGQSFYEWRDEHFNEYKHENWSSWSLKKGHFKIVMDQIAPMTRRGKSMKAEIAEVIYPDPRRVKMGKVAQAQYDSMAEKFVMAMGEDEKKIKTNTPGANYNKLRQISAGFIYDNQGKGVDLHEAKYRELDSLIGELQGAQLIIVYHFQHQLQSLYMRYHGRGIMDAGETGAVKKWNEGKIQLMALHPQSEGHGLNLHLSGAHNMVLLSEPETAGLWGQVVGRLARTGQMRAVYVHRIHCVGTIDAVRASKVKSKIRLLAAVLAHVERHQERVKR